MNILSIIRRTENLDDSREFSGKLYPFKSYLVLIFQNIYLKMNIKLRMFLKMSLKKNKMNDVNFIFF